MYDLRSNLVAQLSAGGYPVERWWRRPQTVLPRTLFAVFALLHIFLHYAKVAHSLGFLAAPVLYLLAELANRQWAMLRARQLRDSNFSEQLLAAGVSPEEVLVGLVGPHVHAHRRIAELTVWGMLLSGVVGIGTAIFFAPVLYTIANAKRDREELYFRLRRNGIILDASDADRYLFRVSPLGHFAAAFPLLFTALAWLGSIILAIAAAGFAVETYAYSPAFAFVLGVAGSACLVGAALSVPRVGYRFGQRLTDRLIPSEAAFEEKWEQWLTGVGR